MNNFNLLELSKLHKVSPTLKLLNESEINELKKINLIDDSIILILNESDFHSLDCLILRQKYESLKKYNNRLMNYVLNLENDMNESNIKNVQLIKQIIKKIENIILYINTLIVTLGNGYSLELTSELFANKQKTNNYFKKVLNKKIKVLDEKLREGKISYTKYQEEKINLTEEINLE